MTTFRSDELTPERQQVLALHKQGFPVRRIAQALNVSTQRVYQQLQKLKDAGLIEEQEST